MTKHTESAGDIPNGSIDFNKVHDAAKAGKDDIFAGAVTHQIEGPKAAAEPDSPDLAALDASVDDPAAPARKR